MDPSTQHRTLATGLNPNRYQSTAIPASYTPSSYQMASQYQNPSENSPAMAQKQVPSNPTQKPSVGIVQVRTIFMTEDRQAKAIQLAKEACLTEKMQQSPRDIAGHIKMGFDALYGPCWHCIVGRSFGSYVTHEKENFIFFYVDQWAIMLFKTA